MSFSSRKARLHARVCSIRHTSRPRLEQLEARLVLSTFTVINRDDSGAGSLRQAIVDANANVGGDIIGFAPGVTGTITLTSGELAITDAVALQGPGSGVITVSGNNAFRVFDVSANATISGLTISGGKSDNGGGIYNNGGTLAVSDSTLEDSVAYDDGGGIYNNGGTLVLNNSCLSRNSVFGNGNLPSNPNGDSLGGGIYNNGGTLVLNNSCLSGSFVWAGDLGNAEGSGVYNLGTLTVTNSSLSDNVAKGAYYGNAEGAGVYNLGTLTVTNSGLFRNSAYTGDDGVGGTSAGGGIYNGGTLTVVNSSVWSNSADTGRFRDGGTSEGGGIYNGGGTLTIVNSTLLDNAAHCDKPFASPDDPCNSFGGGIYNMGTLSVVSGTLSGNTAECSSNDGSGSGGGGGIATWSPTTLNNTIVANSTGADVAAYSAFTGSHNLIEDGTGGLPDTITGDPKLGLVGSGVGSLMMALLAGSPAIDAGSNALAVDPITGSPLVYDQRGPGFLRVLGSFVDIGAYEAPAPLSTSNLQTALAGSAQGGTGGSVTVQATSNADVSNAVTAVNGLANPNPSVPETVTLDLGGGTYTTDTRVNAQPGVTLVITNGTLVGGSPALVVDSGDVILNRVTALNATNAPTILVNGGSLVIRNSTIQESSGYAQAAILVTGGTVDLGAAINPGGNTINVNGTGELIHNTGAAGVSALGDTFQVNGTTLTSGYAIEDKIFHALDAGGGGLVMYDPSGDFVTAASGSVQRGINAVPSGGTVHVAAGVSSPLLDIGARLVMVSFDGGPAIGFQVDPLYPTQRLLSVLGTPGDDTINVRPGDSAGEIKVKIGGNDRFRYRASAGPAVGRIAVYGGAGDDDITVNGGITTPAWLYGGSGDDRLKGGGGPSVLLGGSGDDLLVGASGRDILIGGIGSDKIVGDSGDDILIAGYTAYDANDAALASVVTEWTSNRSYADRVRNLRGDASSPTFAARANGEIFLAVDGTYGRTVTVFDDGAADILTGGGGLDWFLFNADGDNGAKKDKVTDLSAREFVDDLDFING